MLNDPTNSNVKICDRHGNELDVSYSDAKRNDNYFIVGLHKAGSVLLNTVVRLLCAQSSLQFIDIPAELFRLGLRDSDFPFSEIRQLDRSGYVYGGFRNAYLVDRMPSYKTSKKLLLVRDPRDAAVSFFFSLLHSHSEPGCGPEAEHFRKWRDALKFEEISSAVTSGKLDLLFRYALPFCSHRYLLDDLLIFRYEDIIFEKRRWISNIANFLELEINSTTIDEITNQVNVFPSDEDASLHIRQVFPGNHKSHLTRDAVRYIEEISREFFEAFGYRFCEI